MASTDAIRDLEPDSINEFAVVGEFGFKRVEGPFRVDKDGTVWVVFVPVEEADWTVRSLSDDEGNGAVLVADGEIVGGGILVDAVEPEGEDEIHVIIDQYARGDP